MAKKEVPFNTIPLTRFASTIASISGVEKPYQADENVVPEIIDLVKKKTGKPVVDKVLIYNPDAIGMEFYTKYQNTIFGKLDARTDLQVKFITAIPPKTPVCFATMFTGANPDVHGISHYEKPVLKIDTLFDAWARAGKKVALVSKGGQSIPKIFAERNIDYFITKSDIASVKKGVELIASNKYDIVEVYNQEYDDLLHATHPRSYLCKRAATHYVRAYEILTDAVKKYWKGTSLTTFSPDHGAHRIGKIFIGTHGDNIPSDMNIVHFFSVFNNEEIGLNDGLFAPETPENSEN